MRFALLLDTKWAHGRFAIVALAPTIATHSARDFLEGSALPSLTIENYVKTIYQVCADQAGGPAATGQLSDALNVSPGTVTSMVKTLSDTGLVHYIPYEGVHLTESGRKLALRVLRRHRLIELFLAKTLDLNWDEVHDEAENMEHAVSDLLVDRIDQFLGHPEVDPHGDPIPKADGTIVTSDSRKLSELAAGEPFQLVRVLDQSPRFLRYLSDSGLPLGSQGEVLDKCMEAGVITILVGENETSLSRDAAAKLLVSAAVGVA